MTQAQRVMRKIPIQDQAQALVMRVELQDIAPPKLKIAILRAQLMYKHIRLRLDLLQYAETLTHLVLQTVPMLKVVIALEQ